MAGGSARWRLEITGPDGSRRGVPLNRDVVVGRDRDVGLRLDDQSVSRKHARLYFDETGALWVEDLGSGNGVVLDGLRLGEPAAVPSGAEITLGVFKVVAQDVGGPARAIVKAQKGQLPAEKPKGPAKGELPAPSGCALRGRSGPFLNREFALQKALVRVGRVADGNDIPIQDDSISRQHARLVRSGRGYFLRDLESANGTSVNGERVVERPLSTGDVVRFGAVEFDYFGPPPLARVPLDPKRKRSLVLGAVAVALLLIVIGALKLQAAGRDTGPVVVQTTLDDVAEAERLVGMAQDERRDEHWDRAIAKFEDAIRLDPINMDARKGLKDVQREVQMKQLIDHARQRVDVGQDEDGVELYLKIDPDSTYYPRAQAEIQRLASLLTRRYQELCVTSTREQDATGIVEGCGHYLNLVCNTRADEATLKTLRAAEKKLGPKVKEPWACPASYAHWAMRETGRQAASLEARIAEKYTDPRLAEDVRIYANGQARASLNGLRNLKDVAAESHNPDVDRLLHAVELAYGAYTDGVSSLETGDVRSARQQWQLLLDTDRQIMPEGFASELANQARKQLAKQYYKMGQQMFQQGRLVDAYQTWDLGFVVQPGDNDLQQGFIALEHEAEKILANAGGCADFKQTLSITRSNPPSLSHKRAASMAREAKCKGF